MSSALLDEFVCSKGLQDILMVQYLAAVTQAQVALCAFIVVPDCMAVIDFLLAKAAEHGSIREEMNMEWIKAGYYRPLVHKTSPTFLLACFEYES